VCCLPSGVSASDRPLRADVVQKVNTVRCEVKVKNFLCSCSTKACLLELGDVAWSLAARSNGSSEHCSRCGCAQHMHLRLRANKTLRLKMVVRLQMVPASLAYLAPTAALPAETQKGLRARSLAVAHHPSALKLVMTQFAGGRARGGRAEPRGSRGEARGDAAAGQAARQVGGSPEG